MGLRPEFERLRTEKSPVSDWSGGGDFMGESTWLKVDAAWILHLCTPLQQHLSYGYPSHCLLEKFITTEGTPDYWEASLWAVRKLPGLKGYAVELFYRNHQANTSVVLEQLCSLWQTSGRPLGNTELPWFSSREGTETQWPWLVCSPCVCSLQHDITPWG